ncbi:AraC family transcriptional regulator [Microbulbifer agarilyticus]|uniref:AraC family transcriptional regulator n=1 Tax=Microbulbifer agarilyticus TaxID=260552 RepID=UPI001C94CD2E|nr:AraC family transcriptional regulator [Microbulbifer agarilyticus]MBY6189913.1 AraC family transcriptional regulator [Microbulbifer agarilyticus]
MRDISVHVCFVKAVLKKATEQGYDVERLLRRSRISPRLLEQSQARVSAEQYAKLQTVTMREMGDEMLGYCPQPFRLGQWSALCHWLIQCRTLGQAMKRFCLFYDILNQNLAPRLFVEEDRAIVEIRQVSNDAPPFEPYVYEFFCFSLHRQFCWLTQQNLPLTGASVPYPQPEYSEEYRPLFAGAPVEYDADVCRLAFDRRLLEKPVKQTPQSLAEFLRKPLYNTLVNSFRSKSWSQKIKDVIGDDLSAVPTFAEIAAHLGLNPKQLRRQLNDEGLNYSDLKVQIRRDQAIYHLSRQRTSIEEIAFLTGFSEASAFIRAFRSWTGVTPLTYRKDLS